MVISTHTVNSMSNDSGVLAEAYERFHKTGPEFEGYLSNHGPMAVEAMVRHGHSDTVHRWVDAYSRRLENQPRGLAPVTDEDWREALGAIERVADWTAYFARAVALAEWHDVLAVWWPRLLPGIAAGATHGVIRVGHAVHTLQAEPGLTDESDPRIVELAHALAYWAARWRRVPGGTAARAGELPPSRALAAVPAVPDQSRGIDHRTSQIAATLGWEAALDSLTAATTADQARTLIADLADAATLRYLARGHGNPVMLVHSATAPTAVLRTLPALPEQLWIPSLDAAWLAAAAVTAAYAPTEPAGPGQRAGISESELDPAGVLERAVAHGDEHVIKFADTAADVWARTSGNRDALAAALRCAEMI
jgi:hypothetical protein